MKYPCTDGHDRDAALEEYVRLEREVAQSQAEATRLTLEVERARRRMSDIQFHHLGAIGAAQLPAVRRVLR